MTDEHNTEGGEAAEEPTAVERPIAEDETSPEGIPADEEATGVEVEDPPAPSDETPARPHANVASDDLDPPPQVRLLHRPPEPLEWRVARFVAAIVLAGGAFGMHMWLNVPEVPVVANPKDQGAAKEKGRGEKNARERMPERSEDELERAWDEWGGVPFDEEPMRGRWSRDMQTMVNKAVVVARKAAFAGAPEDPRVIVTGTQCRTIRCSFILRSPYEHEVELLAKSLERVTYDGEPMWREVKSEVIEPPTPQSPKDDFYRQVTVGVRIDGYEPASIAFAGDEAVPDDENPAEPEPAPAKPDEDEG